jgi:hypothetical protein
MKTSIQLSELLDSMDIPPGQVRRTVGDVFMFDRHRYVVEAVSASRAVARRLSQQAQKTSIKDSFTGESIQDASPVEISISNCCDRGDVIDHISSYHAPSKKSNT